MIEVGDTVQFHGNYGISEGKVVSIIDGVASVQLGAMAINVQLEGLVLIAKGTP